MLAYYQNDPWNDRIAFAADGKSEVFERRIYHELVKKDSLGNKETDLLRIAAWFLKHGWVKEYRTPPRPKMAFVVYVRERCAVPNWHEESPEMLEERPGERDAEVLADARREPAQYKGDPWDRPVVAYARERDAVTIAEVLRHLLGAGVQYGQADQNRVARILRYIGWEKRRDPVPPDGSAYGVRPWRYVRPE